MNQVMKRLTAVIDKLGEKDLMYLQSYISGQLKVRRAAGEKKARSRRRAE